MLDDTDDIRIVRKTNNFIDLINNEEDVNLIWQNLINNDDLDTVKEMLMKISIFTNRSIITESKKREQLAEILFNSIDVNKKENISGFTSIEYSILSIVSELIGECNKEDFAIFRKTICDRYNMLCVIADIVYRMKHTYGGLSSEFSSNTDGMQKLFDEMCKEALNNVNLYSDYNYSLGNAYSFYDYWHQKEDKNILKYLNKIVSSKNVYRILFDTFSFTVNENDEYGYKVNKQLYDRMQLSQLSKLNDLLNESQDMNNDQRRVVYIYQRYTKGEKDFNYYKDEINPQRL